MADDGEFSLTFSTWEVSGIYATGRGSAHLPSHCSSLCKAASMILAIKNEATNQNKDPPPSSSFLLLPPPSSCFWSTVRQIAKKRRTGWNRRRGRRKMEESSTNRTGGGEGGGEIQMGHCSFLNLSLSFFILSFISAFISVSLPLPLQFHVGFFWLFGFELTNLFQWSSWLSIIEPPMHILYTTYIFMNIYIQQSYWTFSIDMCLSLSPSSHSLILSPSRPSSGHV